MVHLTYRAIWLMREVWSTNSSYFQRFWIQSGLTLLPWQKAGWHRLCLMLRLINLICTLCTEWTEQLVEAEFVCSLPISFVAFLFLLICIFLELNCFVLIYFLVIHSSDLLYATDHHFFHICLLIETWKLLIVLMYFAMFHNLLSC